MRSDEFPPNPIPLGDAMTNHFPLVASQLALMVAYEAGAHRVLVYLY